MTALRRVSSLLKLLGEIDMAGLSFFLYIIVRFSLRRMVSLYFLLHKKQALIWRVISADTLKMPMALPIIMTTGPRWNTHAITASVGPFNIKQLLGLNVGSAEKSAQFWTIVVNTFPNHQTVMSVGSLSSPFDNEWKSLSLRPGKYTLTLRYYRWSDYIELPAVKVDGVNVVPARLVPPEINSFYRDLIERSNFFYLCLHYHIFTLLRFRKWLSKSFVDGQFLPVGNPETQFYYGILQAGESLRMELDSSLLATHDVYLTIYNRASFPIVWYQVTETEHVAAESTSNCLYLVRIHKNQPIQQQFERDWVRIAILRQRTSDTSPVRFSLADRS